MPGLQYSRLHLKIYNKDQDKLHSHRNYYKKYLLSVNGSIEVNCSFLVLSFILNFSSSHGLSFFAFTRSRSSLLPLLLVFEFSSFASSNPLAQTRYPYFFLHFILYLTLLLPLVVSLFLPEYLKMFFPLSVVLNFSSFLGSSSYPIVLLFYM